MLHGAIGRALESTHANRMDDGAAVLAHHFGRAEDWPAAIRFGRRAAERAIALSQFADALGTIDQALEWAGRLPGGGAGDLTADLLLQQERLCETLGLRARQQRDHRLADRTAGAGRQFGAAGRGLPASGRPLDAAQAIRRGRSSAGNRAPDRAGPWRHDAVEERAPKSRTSAMARRTPRRGPGHHAARARRRSGVPRRRRSRRSISPTSEASSGRWATTPGRGRCWKKRSPCRRSATIRRSWCTPGTISRTSFGRPAISIERSNASLKTMRLPRPSAADPAIVPPHVDRAYSAAAGPHRSCARDVSRRGRFEPPRPPRGWPGAIAADARQRTPGPRPVRGGAAVPSRKRRSCSRNSKTACRKPKCGRGVARILERRSPPEAAEAWNGRPGASARARRFQERAGGARGPCEGAARRRQRGRCRGRVRISAGARGDHRRRVRARRRFGTCSASSSGSAADTPRRCDTTSRRSP